MMLSHTDDKADSFIASNGWLDRWKNGKMLNAVFCVVRVLVYQSLMLLTGLDTRPVVDVLQAWLVLRMTTRYSRPLTTLMVR